LASLLLRDRVLATGGGLQWFPWPAGYANAKANCRPAPTRAQVLTPTPLPKSNVLGSIRISNYTSGTLFVSVSGPVQDSWSILEAQIIEHALPFGDYDMTAQTYCLGSASYKSATSSYRSRRFYYPRSHLAVSSHPKLVWTTGKFYVTTLVVFFAFWKFQIATNSRTSPTITTGSPT
jgi:hypothetical protein